MNTVRYKLQGNGKDSWVIDEKELTYDSPAKQEFEKRVEEVLAKNNYKSISEVLIWIGDADYGNEAQKILDWYRKEYKAVTDYKKNNPKEETVLEFIETISIFDKPKKK